MIIEYESCIYHIYLKKCFIFILFIFIRLLYRIYNINGGVAQW